LETPWESCSYFEDLFGGSRGSDVWMVWDMVSCLCWDPDIYPSIRALNPEAGLPADTLIQYYNSCWTSVEADKNDADALLNLYRLTVSLPSRRRHASRDFGSNPIFWTASINQSIAHCFTSFENNERINSKAMRLLFKAHVSTYYHQDPRTKSSRDVCYGRDIHLTSWLELSPLWAKDHRTSIEITPILYSLIGKTERLKRLEKCIRCSMT